MLLWNTWNSGMAGHRESDWQVSGTSKSAFERQLSSPNWEEFLLLSFLHRQYQAQEQRWRVLLQLTAGLVKFQ